MKLLLLLACAIVTHRYLKTYFCNQLLDKSCLDPHNLAHVTKKLVGILERRLKLLRNTIYQHKIINHTVDLTTYCRMR